MSSSGDARGRGLVGFQRLDAAVVDRELLEVGQNRKRQLGRPGVAAKLVCRRHVALDVHGRLLGLDEELARAADAEGVVGRLGAGADLDDVLVDDVPVGLSQTLAVVHVPAERLEEGVEVIAAKLRLGVTAVAVVVEVQAEALDQLDDLLGCRHRSSPLFSKP